MSARERSKSPSNNSSSNYGASSNYGEQDIRVHTWMIKNTPCSCGQDEILGAVEELGFQDDYDFFYLPIRRTKPIGYAFIGFPDPEVAKNFAKAMTGYRWKAKNSTKVVTVVPAHIQGIVDNIEHFNKTSVMQSSTRPIFQLRL